MSTLGVVFVAVGAAGAGVFVGTALTLWWAGGKLAQIIRGQNR